MNTLSKIVKQAAGLILSVIFVLGMILLFKAISSTSSASIYGNNATGPPIGTGEIVNNQLSYPPPETPLPTSTFVPEPTLPPSEPTSTPSSDEPETPPLPEGRAVTLHNGNIWLVEPGKDPKVLIDSGDVSAILGINRNGSILLFGRGRYMIEGDFGDTTDLWTLDLNTNQITQLTFSNKVKTASWSSNDNRIAYCEHGDELFIIDLRGNILHSLNNTICDFTWSPDGLVIALQTYTSDMIADDGLKFDVLTAWWPSDGKIMVFSDAKDEVHSFPVWSTDGQTILFQIHTFSSEPGKQELDGWYLADLKSSKISRLGGPTQLAAQVSRSPLANQITFRIGLDIFVMNFAGDVNILGQGYSATWLIDGKNLLFRSIQGTFQVSETVTDVLEVPAGGNEPSPGIYMQREYFIFSGWQQ